MDGPDPRGATPGAVAWSGATALLVAMGIGRFAFTPVLPMMLQEGALSVPQGGWLATANYAGYLLGALSAAAFGTRATVAIRAGLAVIGLSTAAMALTGSLTAWLLLRGAAGVGSAWVLVHVSAWALGRLAALGRPRLGGAVFAGVGMGIAVAGGLCVVLMHASVGSTGAWLALGSIALGATAVIWPVVGAGHPPAPSGSGAAPARDGGGADALRVLVCYGVLGFGYIVPATFVPVMARQIVRDPLVFGSSWPAFGIAAAASTLLAAAAGCLLGNRRLWAGGHLVMALGVVAPLVWPRLGGVMVAALLVGGTFMVCTMAGMQEARTVGGARATVLMAEMTAAFATGQMAGPLLVVATASAGGGFSGSLALAGLLLLGSGAVLLLAPPTTSAPRSRTPSASGRDGSARSPGARRSGSCSSRSPAARSG